MKTFAITGDRSMYPGVAIPPVALLVAKLLVEHGPIRLVLGLEQGVEAAVRVVAKHVGVEVTDLQWLTKDWEAYGDALVAAGAEKIFVIHGDPHVSSMYPGLVATQGKIVELYQPDLYVG